MAYDKGLARRVRKQMEILPGFAEKQMFGGLCFSIFGNMAVGVVDRELIVRVGPGAYAGAVKLPNARLFEFTGKPIKGWVTVSAGGIGADGELQSWLARGLDFAGSLPPK